MAPAYTTTHRQRAPLAAVLLLSLLPLFSPQADAAQVPWHSRTFKYVADNKDLKEVLRDLSASQSIATWISPEVTGTLSGKFETSRRNSSTIWRPPTALSGTTTAPCSGSGVQTNPRARP